jgi:anti-sigma regulatory factor (Ser/Thr protein kinase)
VRSERETTGKEDSRPGHHGDGTSTTPWAGGPYSAWRKVFPGRVESVPEARTWARDLLAGRVEDSVLDDVLLLLSELATNAVAHSDSGRTADGRVTVYVARLPGAVHVEVTDEGSDTSAPAVRVPEADGDGGRGLWLVESLSTEWGFHPDEPGRSVWFRVAG